MNLRKVTASLTFAFSHRVSTVRDNIERDLMQPVRDSVLLHERAISSNGLVRGVQAPTMGVDDIHRLTTAGLRAYFSVPAGVATAAGNGAEKIEDAAIFATIAAERLGTWGSKQFSSTRSKALAVATLVAAAAAAPFSMAAAIPLAGAGALLLGHGIVTKAQSLRALGLSRQSRNETRGMIGQFESMVKEHGGRLLEEGHQAADLAEFHLRDALLAGRTRLMEEGERAADQVVHLVRGTSPGREKFPPPVSLVEYFNEAGKPA